MSDPCLWCGKERSKKTKGIYCKLKKGNENCGRQHLIKLAWTGELQPDSIEKCKVCGKDHPYFKKLRNKNYCSFVPGPNCKDDFRRLYQKNRRDEVRKEKNRKLKKYGLPQKSGQRTRESLIPDECNKHPVCATFCSCFGNYFMDHKPGCYKDSTKHSKEQTYMRAIDTTKYL